MTNNIMTYLFFTGFILGAVSWCYGIVEAIGTSKFVLFHFKHGLIIKIKTYELPLWHNKQGQELSFLNGEVKILSEKECLFKTNYMRLFVTPFPLRGIITWDNNKAEVITRLPNGTTGFFFAFAIVFIPTMIMELSSKINGNIGLLGSTILIAMVIFGITYEIKVSENIIDQFIKYIKKQELTNGSTADRV